VSEIKGPRYKIDREIGRGAFGVVYLARDNLLRRNVALKVMSIPEGLTEDERQHLVDRFYREARAAAGLTHANIVTIHDISKARDKHFISMELLEGQPLSDLSGGGPVSIKRALRIADEALAGLEYAHSHEVIHRDIKPDNVFLLDGDSVKLVDFGLARVQASTTITQSGTVMGSPGYIAPEVIDGKSADKRTDVFSFGVMLYEMLTGVRPFGPRDAFESFVRVIYRIMSERPPLASSLNPDVPPELDAVLEKALAKEPDDRYQDAGEMREALAAVARGVDFPDEPAAPSQKTLPKKAVKTGGGSPEAGVLQEALTVGDGQPSADAREDASRTAVLAFQEELDREQGRGRGSKRKVAIIAGLAVLVIAAVVVVLVMTLGGISSSEVKVPNVVNLDKAIAVKAIQKAGLKTGKIEDKFAYDIWKGKVATQKPSAGTTVPRNSSVDLEVSIGSKVAQVPDVVGKPEALAVQTVKAFTFTPKVVKGYSETVPVGSVVATRPASGTLKASGEVVDIVVNDGIKPPGYVSPTNRTPVPPKQVPRTGPVPPK
jgi:eukaryotic-like serine/threonine-protein kinase